MLKIAIRHLFLAIPFGLKANISLGYKTMALGRLEVKAGSKGKAQPHFNYIFGLQKFDYKKEEVIFTQSRNLPKWAENNPEYLWQMSDECERKNGSTYREYQICLPRELTLEQNLSFLDEWIKQEIGNLPYSFGIHQPKATDGKSQPHCHLMVCERPDDGIERTATQYFKRYNSKNPEKGGAKKINTGMTNQERDEQIKGLRIRFGQLLNHHLAKNGFEPNIDMRNWRERGVEKPQNMSMIEWQNKQVLKELTEKYTQPTPQVEPPKPSQPTYHRHDSPSLGF